MITVAYITHYDGRIETRTFTQDSGHRKALAYLCVQIATGAMNARQVTFTQVD